MRIAALIFPDIDQMDLTGPFEVLSGIAGAEIHLVWKETGPVRDYHGLVLTASATLETNLDPLDVLLVPGGPGQVPLMEDEKVLSWIRARASQARYVLAVCTGALTLGAAGLLQDRRATTHWNSTHLLPYFGAITEDARVVVDGNLITTGGVTAGIDGSLHLAALLSGEETAQRIQLAMHYAPEPPFASGDPAEAPKPVYESVLEAYAPLTEKRLAVAQRLAMAQRTQPAAGH
jgi:cyclohexyl-isocyanide hydratase